MTKTRGFVEIAVGLLDYQNDYQLDYAEEEAARIHSGMVSIRGQPPPLALLRSLIDDGTLWDYSVIRDILRVTDTEGLAEITVCRLKDTLKAPDVLVEDTSSLFELINQFARHPKHQICEALMNRGAGRYCTKLIVKIALAIKRIYPRRFKLDFEALLYFGFRCLLLLVKTMTGLPWIIQFVNAGIFSAFVEASVVFHCIADHYYRSIAQLFSSHYLCYRSVLEAVDTMVQNLEKIKQFLALQSNRGWKVMEDLTKLTAMRKALITLELKA